MGFSAKQIRLLRKQPHRRHLRTRQTSGRELTYIEGWHAIEEANRIFGFDGWDRETVESRCIAARESQGVFRALYAAKVRVTVRAEGINVVREGSGTSEARGVSSAEAHDLAMKSAETDATKRALATFGRSFGLALHLCAKRQLKNTDTASQPSTVKTGARGMTVSPNAPAPGSSVSNPRDVIRSKPIKSAAASSLAPKVAPHLVDKPSGAPLPDLNSPSAEAADNLTPVNPGAADGTGDPVHDDGRSQIDKSVLTHGAERRYRDRKHLQFVATQPCLICSRQPSDAHHLRFTQPRSMGRKVSDQYTVPLCRLHHRELHQSGHEQNWWETHNIDPLPIASGLWSESRLARLGKPGSSILSRAEP